MGEDSAGAARDAVIVDAARTNPRLAGGDPRHSLRSKDTA